MWKRITLLILSIILLQSTNAIIIETTTDIIYEIDVTKHDYINIFYDDNTTHSFPIFNVSIIDIPHLSFTMIDELKINETKKINYTVNIDEPITDSFQGKLTYLYITNITTIPQNHTININNSGFSPGNLTMFQNDSILWSNIDNTNHTTTDLNNPSNSIELGPGDIIQEIFSNTGIYNYFDEYTQIGGQLNIIKNTVKSFTHTPSFDIDLTFNLDNQVSPIEINVIPESFSMSHLEIEEGVLRLSTNNTIFNLHLEGDWFTFLENDFDLETTDIIIFSIKPDNITETSDTNKEYIKKIKITGTNLIEQELSIPIFIELFNFTTESKIKLVYEPLTAEETIKYCEDRDYQTEDCQLLIKNESYPIYIERIIDASLNESDFIKVIGGTDKIIESNDNLRNSIDQSNSNNEERITNLETSLDSVLGTLNSMTDKLNPVFDLATNKQENDSFASFMRWFLGLSIGSVYGIYRLVKFVKKRKKVSTGMGF